MLFRSIVLVLLVFGGLVFVAVVLVGLGNGSLRKLYFPGAAKMAVGAAAD